jgi:hypothetical protein
MLAIFHRSITQEALGQVMSKQALEEVVQANLGQDAWYYQFIHPHFHFDNNAFSGGQAYIREQKKIIFRELGVGRASQARKAFGRLTHTAQDFYAHSNYVSLWLENHPQAADRPTGIDPLDSGILGHAGLRSGRFYVPVEFLYFIPALRLKVLEMLPRDSHAWMNLDAPSQPNFEFAFQSAVKRTAFEYEEIIASLNQETIQMFNEYE